MANDFDYFTFRISHLVSTSNECAKNIVMFSVSSFICFRFFFLFNFHSLFFNIRSKKCQLWPDVV